MRRIAFMILLLSTAACEQVGEQPEYYLDPPNIPQQFMPPRGQCRVWHSNVRPELQPPPGECGVLKNNVPKGAILIWG